MIIGSDMNKHHFRHERIDRPNTPVQSEIKLRTGDPPRSKVRVVCRDCNTTWLSQIQERAKPHLIPLITGQTFALGATSQESIAVWCTMATMTAEYIPR